MVRSEWPQPNLEFRTKVVNLIVQGEANKAIDLLAEEYEMPSKIVVLTPRQILQSNIPGFEETGLWVTMFDFEEWMDLKEAFPDRWKKAQEFEHLEIVTEEMRTRVGWVFRRGIKNDYIIISERYDHPAIPIHEFHHILAEYLGHPFTDYPHMHLCKPESWDLWTRRFLLGTGYRHDFA